MMGPMMYGPYGGGMWLFFHFLFWILVIIGIILLIVWIIKQPGRHERGQGEETALDILKKRYAGGEITKEEFESMTWGFVNRTKLRAKWKDMNRFRLSRLVIEVNRE